MTKLILMLALLIGAPMHVAESSRDVGRNLCEVAKSAGPELMDAFIGAQSPTSARFDAQSYCEMFCGDDQVYCTNSCTDCLSDFEAPEAE